MKTLRISNFRFRTACHDVSPSLLALLIGLALSLATAAMAQSDGKPTLPVSRQSDSPATTQRELETQLAMPISVTFARSGQMIDATLLPLILGRHEKDAAALFAFGRRWATSDVYQTSARCWTKVTVPSVRVPTIFTIAPP
ncbi:MAG: hypothetical protein JW741_27000, partial [Sedimentisphaerales bacterium]|nr:hypothetical protein [Sedimentisphaerales bacterium]